MYHQRRFNLSSAAMLGAALAALIALATLQYSWVGRMSDGEQARMQANLAISAQRFGEDFDRELARAYLSFQMDAETLERQDWERYAARYERWLSAAPYPELVDEIFLVQVNQIGRLTIARYDHGQRRFLPHSWEPALVTIRRRFERTYLNSRKEAAAPTFFAKLPSVAEELPALLVEVARSWKLSDPGAPSIDADLLFSDLVLPNKPGRCASCLSATSSRPLLAYTIVTLDRAFIEARLLPELTQRYFPGQSGLDYHVAVVGRAGPEQVIYGSTAQARQSGLPQGDAEANILDVRFGDLNQLLLNGEFRPDDRGEGSQRVAIGILSGDEAPDPDGDGAWKLVIKHRAGSLGAAAAALRTRNLLLSFGTLLILAGSIAMLIISSRRAQHLARQQIAFASAVSHELRTPLAVICSAGENLADGLVHDPQKARQYGQVIYHEGRRLTDMIEQVLAFASAQAGQGSYNLQPAEVAPIIDGALQSLQVALRGQGFTVERSVQPGLPPISADAEALRRSIQNLIGNAIKYAADGRHLTVSAEAAAGEGGPELRIAVADRGPGIDPGDLPYIFEPFFRGRNAAAMQSPGSGLGLSLIRHVAEAHGGRVSVETAPGHGACFTLHLPLPPPDQTLARPGPWPHSAELAGGRDPSFRSG